MSRLCFVLFVFLLDVVYDLFILTIFNNFKVYAGGGGVFEKVFVFGPLATRFATPLPRKRLICLISSASHCYCSPVV